MVLSLASGFGRADAVAELPALTHLEDLVPGMKVRGILPDGLARVIHIQWHGQHALTLTYADAAGRTGQQLLYRQDEGRLTLEPEATAWSLDADGHLFRLASEAKRISLAYLFDPFLAVQASILEPLPHQIQAVYHQMLPRQPLRFLLADDPGAGKTIMAGLFIKELMVRGDLDRCLVIAPGSLVEQWQDELWQKFRLEFDILTRDVVEASRTGNPFQERRRLIVRLDHLARNEDLQAKLGSVDWDLIVMDEAHKLSARHDGPDVKETKRYRVGRLAGGMTRHLLLMTATPHNGKEDEFELFMALLDPDRFAGRARAQRPANTRDLMRRLVKENLLRFDGRRLFPERRALSPTYPLSDPEDHLYQRVSSYVRDEMNRADRLRSEGEGRRGLIVGFALTTLQRRLASSPQAIHESLKRRLGRLQARLELERKRRLETLAPVELQRLEVRDHFRDDDEFDEDDLDAEEREDLEGELVDEATAARTIVELEREIGTLTELLELAAAVRRSGTDRKWEELSRLLQDNSAMFDADGKRRKLIVFTEHRDTLEYLVDRLTDLTGRPESVVAIHGGLRREARRLVQERFLQDSGVVILVATDAAGEGVNLQRAHLMVNYDLPWNPNRIEQRFGRIHRIGQTEVCWLWNLVAEGTREGEVFQRLFTKLEEQRKALGDQVFDVLGQSFGDRSLRDLLIEAVRYGDRPEVRARLDEVVDEAVGGRLRQVVHERALVTDVMNAADVESIRDEMERADARRLQPHFLAAFFVEALRVLGGDCREREPGRFEVRHVPLAVRRTPTAQLLRSYERVTFEKSLMNVAGAPAAELMMPGHPLLDAILGEVLARHGETLQQGTVLVDETDPGEIPRVLVYLQHAIQDGRQDRSGSRRVVSERFEFVEIDAEGRARPAGWAPYLDYRPATIEERELAGDVLTADWIREDLARVSLDVGVTELVPEHLAEVQRRTVSRVDRTIAAVRARLETEIAHWDMRAAELSAQEAVGKQPRMNPERARRRADELQARLQVRLAELEAERNLSPLPPTVVGGALVLPAGCLARLASSRPPITAQETERVERAAVHAVLAMEASLGRAAREMPRNNRGYDIESRAETGDLLFVEVKGRIEGAPTVTITRSEIGVGRNKPDQFILALVEVPVEGTPAVRYLRRPFEDAREPYFGEVSTNFEWKKLWTAAGPPS